MVLSCSRRSSKHGLARLGGISVLVALLGLILTTGCHGPRQQLTVWKEVAGHSVQDRPIDCEVLELTDDGDEDSLTVMIIGTIHGSEPAGEPLVYRLSGYLKANQELLEDRRIVLLPLTNPDGRAINQRHNVNGIDLNRNFQPPTSRSPTSTDACRCPSRKAGRLKRQWINTSPTAS